MHPTIPELLVAGAIGAAVACGSSALDRLPTVCGGSAAEPPQSEQLQPRCNHAPAAPAFDDLVHRLPGARPHPEAVWL